MGTRRPVWQRCWPVWDDPGGCLSLECCSESVPVLPLQTWAEGCELGVGLLLAAGTGDKGQPRETCMGPKRRGLPWMERGQSSTPRMGMSCWERSRLSLAPTSPLPSTSQACHPKPRSRREFPLLCTLPGNVEQLWKRGRGLKWSEMVDNPKKVPCLRAGSLI